MKDMNYSLQFDQPSPLHLHQQGGEAGHCTVLYCTVLYCTVQVRRNVGKLFCCPGQRLASLDLVFATTNIMFKNLGFKQEDAKNQCNSVTSCM